MEVHQKEKAGAWLTELQTQQIKREEFAYTSLADIKTWAGISNDETLFETNLVFENYPVDDALLDPGDEQQIGHIANSSPNHFPLTLAFAPGPQLSIRMSFHKPRFQKPTVDAMLRQLTTLLVAMATEPDCRLEQISLMSKSERATLLASWQPQPLSYPNLGCIHQLFEAQVRENPAAQALLSPNPPGFESAELAQPMSNSELNRKANRLAHLLQSRGVGPESLVALYFERNSDFIVAMLAVLKAGGGYLPLDTRFPGNRLGLILNESGARLLLTHSHMSLPAKEIPHCLLDREEANLSAQSDTNPQNSLHPLNMAYAIFTSGSTGKPKGVAVTHEGILNYLYGIDHRVGLSQCRSFAHVSSPAADLGQTMIFAALAFGATLHLPGEQCLSDPFAFSDYMENHGVECIKITPSHLAALANQGQPERVLPAKKLILSGESTPWALVKSISGWSPGLPVFNNYGPTETTISVLSHTHQPTDTSFPLGKPIPNTPSYVLDSQLEPVPTGMAGELYLGGKSLARGYLNRPDLTGERFLPDPFSTEPGARIYRTGDLTRISQDGLIEFVGRGDHQVKIRGFRVELGEIEAVLKNHPEVREAMVIASSEEGADNRLSAFIVPGTNTVDEARLQRDLRETLEAGLPDYMIPASLTQLQALPLTPNGKLDRAALATAAEEPWEPKPTFEAPRNPLEEALAGIWAEAFNRERVSVLDNFFALGGHSLTALLILGRIKKTFQVTLHPADIFDQPTVRDLAGHIRKLQNPSPIDEEEEELLGEIARLTQKMQRLMEKKGRAPKASGNDGKQLPEPGSAKDLKSLLPEMLELMTQTERNEAQDARDEPEGTTIPVLPRDPDQMRFPLSFAQQRLWFLNMLEGPAATYNIWSALSLAGHLDPDVIARALSEITRRHEILRTGFESRKDHPIQRVYPYQPITVPLVDLKNISAEERRVHTERLALALARFPFDLRILPLIRVVLLRLSEAEHVLLLAMHHIVSDGWSNTILIRELSTLYDAFINGKPSPLPMPPIQYGDFAQWQSQSSGGTSFDAQMEFWRQNLKGAPPLHRLPLDKVRPTMQRHRGARLPFHLPEASTQALLDIATGSEATLFMCLHAAFVTFLAKYSGAEDVVIGSPFANREPKETESLIGVFVNTLVLRTRLLEMSGEAGDVFSGLTFRQLLKEVRQQDLEVFKNGQIPFEQLVEEIQQERNSSYSPLFQIAFALQTASAGELHLPGLKVSGRDIEQGTSKFDLSLILYQHESGLIGTLEYDTDLFEEVSAARMLRHFEHLLQNIAENPDQTLASCSMLAEGDRDRLLTNWSGTRLPFPRDRSAAQLFQDVVSRAPDACAITQMELAKGSSITWENASHTWLSYQNLDDLADDLGQQLRHAGVGPQALVGIFAHRSMDMVAAMLAVLKVGAAYLPLDPTFPKERLGFMLADAQVNVILSQEGLRSQLPDHPDQVITLDSHGKIPDVSKRQSVTGNGSPESMAYVIYTSGSTGKPKGVAIPQRAVNRLVMHADFVEPDGSDRMAQCSNAGFDAATFEIWGSLFNGSRLVIIPKEICLSAGDFTLTLARQRISILFVTTALFHQVAVAHPDGFQSLRCLLFGGEAIDPEKVRLVFGKKGPRRLLHVYGPTENTTFSSWFQVREIPQNPITIPIGRAIANSEIVVLDRTGRLLPTGVPGELLLGGDGLAEGYIRRPALTAARFIPHGFSQRPGARLYKTGDLVRFGPGSTENEPELEFLGRFDHQVKLRGFRIELGEIEAALGSHPKVQETALLLRQDQPGDKRLVAYIQLAQDPVQEDNAHRDAKEEAGLRLKWRRFLKKTLPEFMIPSAFVILDRLPVSATGKLDRAALPAPDGETVEEVYVAPRNPLEADLAAIWKDILHLDQVGIHTDFFDAGGHSLLATRVASRIRETFDIELPLRDMFLNTTIATLAHAIRENHGKMGYRSLPNITPVARKQALPLSYAQKRLWFLNQIDGANPVYNIPLVLRLEGALDTHSLERALLEVVERHEILRTKLPLKDNRPVQRIYPCPNLKITLADFSRLSSEQAAQKVGRIADSEATHVFDLAEDFLFRASLVRLDAEVHTLLITQHHIISDGWSLGVLTRELMSLYNAFRNDQPSPLAPLPIQYADFAHWQRNELEGKVLSRQLGYWKQQLAGAPTLLDLPTDRPRPNLQTFNGAMEVFRMEESLGRSLRDLTSRCGATLFMTLLAAFKVLLWVYSRQNDISVGSPIANRNRREIEGLIGFFVNTLVLRSDLSQAPSFEQFLGQVRQVTLDAYTNQDVPFEQVVEALQPERKLSHNPLFQVLFGFHEVQVEPFELPGLKITPVERNEILSKFDLNLTMVEGEQEWTGAFTYNRDLFDAATIRRMAHQFCGLLETLTLHPDRPLSQISITTKEEREQLLVQCNQTRLDMEGPNTLHQLIEAEVARTPQRVALMDQRDGCSRHLSYGELNQRADNLAHQLQSMGAGPEVLIAICAERSVELVIALLAILKSGAAYLPLDPTYPKERLTFVLEDAQASLLILEEQTSEKLDNPQLPSLLLDRIEEAPQGKQPAVAHAPSPHHLAYVIYTSGSTGKPKGVMNSHGSIANRLKWGRQNHGLQKNDVLLQKTPISFDVSVWELFWPLLCGARLVMAEPGRHGDPAYLMDVIARLRITALHFVPAMLQAFLDHGEMPDCHCVKQVFSSGEALPPALVAAFFAKMQARLHNLYGPTEAAVEVSYWHCPPPMSEGLSGQLVPIGRPITNTRMYILSPSLQPLPMNVPGELYLEGISLARGYLGRPTLSAQSFIPNPFADGRSPWDSRLYKTGDLARWTFSPAEKQSEYLGAKGPVVDYLGRLDHQIKLRGFRIELGEIEAKLKDLPTIKEAVVLLREDRPGHPNLTAYLVPLLVGISAFDQSEQDLKDIKQALRAKLPEFMIPTAVVWLGSLPLTANGKLDRGSLPAPDAPIKSDDTITGPRNEVEKTLVDAWMELLDLEQVDIHTGFFDLGGHSLLATQLIARINEEYGMDLPLATVFETPTVAGQSERIESERKRLGHREEPAELPESPDRQEADKPGSESLTTDLPDNQLKVEKPKLAPIPRRCKEEASQNRFPLSFPQQRLWLLHRFTPENPSYNAPLTLQLEGRLAAAPLESALVELMTRHEILRTTFGSEAGKPVQRIGPVPKSCLTLVDLHNPNLGDKQALAQSKNAEAALRPFDLETGPLFRTTLLRLSPTVHLLLVNMHHITTDGWSMKILVQELGNLYSARIQGKADDLVPLSIQYADFSLWQRDRLKGKVLAAQMEYWKTRLQDHTQLNLPLDRIRPPVQTFRGDDHPVSLSPQVSTAFMKLCRGENVTPFMALLAGFKILLARYSNQNDILVGTPIANRTHVALESLIGFFVNTLALRTDLADANLGPLDFRGLLRRVRRVTLDAFTHQDLPFEKLVEELQPERDPSRSPIVQVMFSYAPEAPDQVPPRMAGLAVHRISSGPKSAKFDMTLNMRNQGRQLVGEINYNRDLFQQRSIQRMAVQFETLLGEITADPFRPLAELSMLGEDQRQQLIHQWNANRPSFQEHQNMAQCFKAATRQVPDAIAIQEFERGEPVTTGSRCPNAITYGELDTRTEKLGLRLKQMGRESGGFSSRFHRPFHSHGVGHVGDPQGRWYLFTPGPFRSQGPTGLYS